MKQPNLFLTLALSLSILADQPIPLPAQPKVQARPAVAAVPLQQQMDLLQGEITKLENNLKRTGLTAQVVQQQQTRLNGMRQQLAQLKVISAAMKKGVAPKERVGKPAPQPRPVPLPAPAPPPTITVDPVGPAIGGARPAPNNNDIAKVNAALKTWTTAKAKCAGNYEYTVSFSSAFGFGHTTTIVVKNNKVVERRYEAFNRRQPPVPRAKPNAWVETGKDLGKNKRGAPVKTLDELYANAAKVAAQPLRPSERRYVRTDKNGLLTSCFIIDRRIADDAPRKGVAIGQIKLSAVGDVAQKVYKAPNGKAFPAHWGAPPRLQTRDLRVLPGGYGRGSGTLARWIQQNLEKDAAKVDGKPQNTKIYRSPSGKAYPAHWGAPPLIQTKDLRVLPGDYGRGSGTLARWISENLARDAKKPNKPNPPAGDATDGGNEPPQIQLGLANNGGTITAKLGSELKIKLPGNPTTGFTWNNKSPKGSVELVGKITHRAANPGLLGSPGQSEAIFKAKTLGKGTIILEYKRVFEQRPAAKTVRINVVVTKDGLAAGPAIPSALALPAVVSLRDAQGGFAGFTGWLTTVQRDGHWERRSFFNRKLQPVKQKGKLSATQLTQLAKLVMETTKPGPLPKQLGKPQDANPRVFTLTIGETQSALTMRTGAALPAAGTDATMNRFTRLAHELAKVHKQLAVAPPQPRPVPPIIVGRPAPQPPRPIKPPVPAPGGRKPFPKHWGQPPRLQTSDYRPLPGGYGFGSSTMAGWIQKNLDADAKNPNRGGGQPAPINPNAKRIAELEKQVKEMETFGKFAQFAGDSRKKFETKLAALKKELIELKAAKPKPAPPIGGKPSVPSFEEWVKGGMKIPAGRVFIGGSPWFDERKGARRQPREVYQMLYGQAGAQPKPKPRPGNGRFPAHWGPPPRLQTRDLRPLPGGYGRGSSTLARWIQQNLDEDKKDPNRAKDGNAPKPGANNPEILRLQQEIARMKDFMTRARFTPEGLAKFKERLAGLEAKLAELQGAKPQGNKGQRPAVSAAFAAKHPAGSYAPGELLVGMQKGMEADEVAEVLAAAVTGLKVKKSMFKNTILHVTLPDTTNVEQAMAKLKGVKAVRYAEVNGIAVIQPVRPGGGIQIQPVRPGLGIQIEPEPQVRPRPLPLQPKPIEIE